MNERREDTRITILRNGQACTLTLEQFLNSAHYDLGHGEPVWFKSSYHYDKSKMFIGEMDGKPVFVGPYLAGDGIAIENNPESRKLGEIKLKYPLPVLAGNAGKVLAVGVDGNSLQWVETSMEHGTTEYWNSHNYVPPAGRIVIYDDHYTDSQGVIHPGMKVGTGNAWLSDLVFTVDENMLDIYMTEINNKLDNHIRDNARHITDDERKRWNSKINASVDDNSCLVLTDSCLVLTV